MAIFRKQEEVKNKKVTSVNKHIKLEKKKRIQ